MISPFLIPIDRFDSPQYIESRLATLDSSIVGAMRTTLRYLYITDGPINLPRSRLKLAEPFLDPAELIVARWLYTRTNGSERKRYGASALQAARKQRYRCEHCGHADVRVLNLDHIEGRSNREFFACLCANCHTLKSRAKDWLGTSNMPSVIE
jgi:hypothetical protein